MRLRVLNIPDVAAAQLCCGCGACAYVSPDEIEMVDDLDHGRRPRVLGGGPPVDARSVEAMRVCPGVGLEHTFDRRGPGLVRELAAEWGPVLEVWEGHAADPEVRFAGSSGGAASAIALYCVERGGMHGVLHTAACEDVPYLNRTVLSTTRDQVLAATGSRYAPASPCDGLGLVEAAPGPCVFVGKPCDVAAVQKARGLRPALDEKIGLTVAFFCAGTPSTKGTLEMLKRMGVEDRSALVSLRYRGNGWPGKATAVFRRGSSLETRELTYEQSWGQLTRFKQWRCHICPDHTGEFADIAVGDPWYRPVEPGEPGRSLILARTARGRALLRDAIEAGYLTVERAEPRILPASQRNLLVTRGSVWGRVLVCRLLGAAAPRYRGFSLFRAWWSALSVREKVRSTLGTVRRVFRRGLRGRIAIVPYRPGAARTSHPVPALADKSC